MQVIEELNPPNKHGTNDSALHNYHLAIGNLKHTIEGIAFALQTAESTPETFPVHACNTFSSGLNRFTTWKAQSPKS